MTCAEYWMGSVYLCVCVCVFYSLQEHGKKSLTVGSLFSTRSRMLAPVQEVRPV